MADREQLEKLLEQGNYHVYTILHNVSRSGMSRVIDCYIILNDEPFWIGASVARVLGRKMKDDSGIVIKGCGMDMGFELVYSLSQALFDDGYKLKQSWL